MKMSANVSPMSHLVSSKLAKRGPRGGKLKLDPSRNHDVGGDGSTATPETFPGGRRGLSVLKGVMGEVPAEGP
ncbi:hypothetical protein THAOC_11546, partial [Thalassiosira oceanica]